MKEKKSLGARVRAIAESGKAVGMPKGFTTPQNKAKREAHIEVCKQLAELSDANGGYPITYLVYFAVGKNAHRIPVFLNGYTSFDEKKGKTIMSWLKLFAKHNDNQKLFRNTDVSHALCHFYDKISTKTNDFKAALARYPQSKQVKDFKEVVKGLTTTMIEVSEPKKSAAKRKQVKKRVKARVSAA